MGGQEYDFDQETETARIGRRTQFPTQTKDNTRTRDPMALTHFDSQSVSCAAVGSLSARARGTREVCTDKDGMRSVRRRFSSRAKSSSNSTSRCFICDLESEPQSSLGPRPR